MRPNHLPDEPAVDVQVELRVAHVARGGPLDGVGVQFVCTPFPIERLPHGPGHVGNLRAIPPGLPVPAEVIGQVDGELCARALDPESRHRIVRLAVFRREPDTDLVLESGLGGPGIAQAHRVSSPFGSVWIAKAQCLLSIPDVLQRDRGFRIGEIGDDPIGCFSGRLGLCELVRVVSSARRDCSGRRLGVYEEERERKQSDKWLAAHGYLVCMTTVANASIRGIVTVSLSPLP